jgi:hypothetical protein
MSDPDLTWVCCPAGISDERLRLSVVAVPRLAPGGTLADFPMLLDWPTQLANVTWRVHLEAGPAGPDPEATRDGAPGDSALWRAMFPSDTTVLGFGTRRDRTQAPVFTYPAVEVARAVRRRYAVAATGQLDDGLQPAAALRPDFDLRPLREFEAGVAAGIEAAALEVSETESGSPGIVEVTAADHPAGSSPVGRAFAMQQPAPPPTIRDAPELDFHSALALLTGHPDLERRLALVVDLSLPLAGLDESVTRVSLSPDSTLPDGALHHFPVTGVVLDRAAGSFDLSARDAMLSRGVWPVDRPEYGLESMDVDTAVRNAVSLASSPDPTVPVTTSPPVLRNDGIALVHTGRAEALLDRMHRSRSRRTTVNGTDEPANDLLAEDLLIGYRVDVRDDASPAYRSLHARRIGYDVDGFGAVPSGDERFHDEGFFQDSLTGDATLYVHERLVTWRGWSLSVPRPDAAPRPTSAVPPELSALHAHITSEVEPRTLPRLRFGHVYQFRLRTVDLAGRSLPLDAAPDVATTTLHYRRYEPVGPPVLAPPGATPAFDRGESLTRLVVRAPSPTPTERMLLPPNGRPELVEQHGVLDDALGAPAGPLRAAAREVMKRAEGLVSLPVGDVVPYLPDPQASGLAFVGLPGAPEGRPFPIRYGRGDSWADVRPVRLRLRGIPRDVAIPPAPSYDVETGVLEVAIQEGEVHRVRVSSTMQDSDLMALLNDLAQDAGGDDFARVKAQVEQGQHPMFTPYAELELVHATPMAQTAFFEGVEPVRAIGDSSVGFQGTVAVHPPTTESVALHARWTEHVDDPRAGAPQELVRSEQVLSVRLPPNAEAVLPLLPQEFNNVQELAFDTEDPQEHLPRHQFGDTGYRQVTYTPVATGRFADCYPEGTTETVADVNDEVVEVLSSAPPPPPVVHSVVPSLNLLPVEVEVSDPAGPEFLETGEPDQLPATEPGWTRTSRVRQGGGIRVYLERPWFVTGADEALGVVLASPDLALQPRPTQPNVWTADPPNQLSPWFSMVGQDPTRRSPGVTPLTRADFLNASQDSNISELRDIFGEGEIGVSVPATILSHVPVFEEQTGLWYADVQLAAAKTYRPFVRLAVARFQPHSMHESVSLSRISTIDIIQPLPDRTLTLLRNDSSFEITVTLHGTTYAADSQNPAARVTAQLYSGTHEQDRWRPIPGSQEVDLVRHPALPLWSAKLPLNSAPPGELTRVLVVERDQMRSRGNDTGPGSKRIVYVGTIDM